MKKAIVIHPNGVLEVMNIDPTTELSQLQHSVGGYIEAVYPNAKTTLWCNEEGARLGLPNNRVASQLWARLQPPAAGVLRGTVVVTGGSDGRGDSLSIDAATESALRSLA